MLRQKQNKTKNNSKSNHVWINIIVVIAIVVVIVVVSTLLCDIGVLWQLNEWIELKLKNEYSAKGRTNIELREQFILADGVSQSMAVFKPKRSIPNAAQNGNNLPPYMSSQGPIMKVNSK